MRDRITTHNTQFSSRRLVNNYAKNRESSDAKCRFLLSKFKALPSVYPSVCNTRESRLNL